MKELSHRAQAVYPLTGDEGARNVCVCVCVCVCVEVQVDAHQNSLFSLLSSSDESLFYKKTPFQQPESSFTESTYPQFLSSIPRFLCFSVCLPPALLYSQLIESEVSWQVRMSLSGRTALFLELMLCAETSGCKTS